MSPKGLKDDRMIRCFQQCNLCFKKARLSAESCAWDVAKAVEETQLHVLVWVGVACRNLEQPDSALRRSNPASLGPAARRCACSVRMSEWEKSELGAREKKSQGVWWRTTYSNSVRGEISGDGWEHELRAETQSRSVGITKLCFCSDRFVVPSCVQLEPVMPSATWHKNLCHPSFQIFISVEHWGLRTFTSIHTCCEALNDTLVSLDSLFLCLDLDRMALSGLCTNSIAPLGHNRAVGATMVAIVLGAHTHTCTHPTPPPPLWHVQAIFYWSPPFRFRPFGSHCE